MHLQTKTSSVQKEYVRRDTRLHTEVSTLGTKRASRGELASDKTGNLISSTHKRQS